MSKKNYNVVVVNSGTIGKLGQQCILHKGYARFLYKKDKILPAKRNSNF